MGIQPTNVSYIDQMLKLSGRASIAGDGETFKSVYGITMM